MVKDPDRFRSAKKDWNTISSKMDADTARASDELESASFNTIAGFASWWNKWYLKAGHKRLGRLMVRIAKAQKNFTAKNVSQMTTNFSTIASNSKEIVSSEVDLKFQFCSRNVDSMAFFIPIVEGGSVLIAINVSHPAFRQINQILQSINLT